MIKLEYPVYHGNMLDYIRKVLRMVCFGCSHLMCDLEGNEEITVPDENQQNNPDEAKAINAITKDFKEA
jgi:DNA-directed RNA polymerase beta' subunit